MRPIQAHVLVHPFPDRLNHPRRRSWSYGGRSKDPFILIFLSLGILPIFFGTWAVQTRILSDIPFQIPAAMGLVILSKQRSGNLLTIAFLSWILAIVVRTVSNYILVIPK